MTWKSLVRGSGWCLIVVSLVVVAYQAQAKSSGDLAAALARLRNEVETLSSQINEKKQLYREQLRSLSMRRSSLELNKQRVNLQLQQLLRKRKKRKKEIAATGQKEAGLTPTLLTAFTQVEAAIKAGLPFRLQGRLKALQELRNKLKGQTIRPRDAANRLWQFVEDELRLSRENGLYRQIIKLHGKDQLVDIARLGMVMMYFKTKDGRYGSAVYEQGKWRYVELKNKQKKEQVSALFVAMKQQIRVGFWTIPNRLRRAKK